MSLFKYVCSERIDILENERIRFTQPAMFNDPFDTKPCLVALTDDNFIASQLQEEIDNDDKLTMRLAESLEKEFRKYGMTKNHPLFNRGLQRAKDIAKGHSPDLLKKIFKLQEPVFKTAAFEAINNTIGVLSLTEKPDNILMWGHYASCHTGFVIEFDEKHAFFDQRKLANELQGYVRKVNYFRERPSLILYDSSKTNEQNKEVFIEKFIWAKNSDWEYEQEWRMVYTLKGKQNLITEISPSIYLFPLPMESIKGIIFGCKMSNENKTRLISLLNSHLKYKQIHIYQAMEDEKKFKINIRKI